MAFCLLVLTTVNVQKWVIYCARDTNNFFFRRCDELFASDGNNNTVPGYHAMFTFVRVALIHVNVSQPARFARHPIT